MIDFDTALVLIATHVAPLRSDDVAVADAAGRVLATPVIAAIDAPRHAVSTMDGYAVRDADLRGIGTTLTVTGESFPGQAFVGSVGKGQAVRIFTGAPLPDGADRVIVQENVGRDGAHIRVTQGHGSDHFIRAAASDFAAGDVLLPAGALLTPRAMVAVAAADCPIVHVTRPPLVAILGTGDELVDVGAARADPTRIPDSVTHGVAAMAAAAGADVVSRQHCSDALPVLEHAAAQALAAADLVVVTGGASVGDRDFAKAMFASQRLDLIFSTVAIKPGKPVWLGRAADTWVIGLPGNPTSAMVTARLLLQPLIAALLGQVRPAPLGWRQLQLAHAIEATGDRETFLRATWGRDGLTTVDNRHSGAQAALADADWLIRCPAGQGALTAGMAVTALRF